MGKKTVVQYHHIRYKGVPRYPGDSTEEWKVPTYKGEHWLISLMNRRKRISSGFITTLEEYIKMHKTSAVDLNNEKL